MKLLTRIYGANPVFWESFVLPVLAMLTVIGLLWLAGYRVEIVKR